MTFFFNVKGIERYIGSRKNKIKLVKKGKNKLSKITCEHGIVNGIKEICEPIFVTTHLYFFYTTIVLRIKFKSTSK